ncbi:MAG TPA: glycosyltransferase [Gemmatimonadales bacterium]|nr:glycosyltransferase [Gemmatimonadales bacterium]
MVPCYNEAARLDTAAVAAFLGRASGVVLVFVDDGSTDGTRAVLHRLAERHGRSVVALRLESNQGKAAAVRTGVLHALRAGAGYVGFWDADLSTPLDEIPRFSAFLDGHPNLVAAIGARVKLLGRQIERSPLRHYLGRVFATGASIALRLPVYDTQCGAKLFRAGPLVRVAFSRPFHTRWIFDVELLARLAEAARRTGSPPVSQLVAELPLESWVDVRGSKLRPLAMIGSGLALAAVRRRARRDVAWGMENPLAWAGEGVSDALDERRAQVVRTLS